MTRPNSRLIEEYSPRAIATKHFHEGIVEAATASRGQRRDRLFLTLLQSNLTLHQGKFRCLGYG